MTECLLDGFVRIFEADVLAGNGNADGVLGGLDAIDEVHPSLHASTAVGAVLGLQLELLEEVGVEALLTEGEGDLVDGGNVGGAGDKVNVAPVADLLLGNLGEGLGAPADDDVGLDARLPHEHRALLARHRLLLVHGEDHGHVGEVDEAQLGAPFLPLHLARGLQEGRGLEMAHRAAHFHNGNVSPLRGLVQLVLDLVRQVRHNLHSRAKVPVKK